ncbi:MAG TPA: hypothetical protein DCS93_00490 [Microscillaceae bacterium]|nr:hypothetical protein [Microscillaceae bacterium]
MKRIFLWNIAPNESEIAIRRIRLLNIACLLTMAFHFMFIFAFLAMGNLSWAFKNILSILYFSIPLYLSIQRKYVLAKIIFVFSSPLNLLIYNLPFAQDVGAQYYLFTTVILAIFIFQQKHLIYLSVVWIAFFFLLITSGVRYHWFDWFFTSGLAQAVDFVWWNNLLGSIITVIAIVSVFRFESFGFEEKLQQQNGVLSEQKEELRQNFEELKSTQEFLEHNQKEIALKNERIESLYSNLSASIEYAKNIQQSIFPPKAKFDKLLPQSFVFFRPRDVVSGDFYYLQSINEKIILAAIDCTGHGVPGAFMSLIGNDILTDLVFNQAITEANVILEKMHLSVRYLLRQQTNENQDGMDIALVVIDKQNQTIEFAGAKNPIVYFQNNQLHLLKGDKTSIGGEQRELKRVFTKHTIELHAPITFYLFSDGIQDQFGGPKNKKFTPARLRNLLQEIQQKPMNEQQNLLSQALDNWQTEGQEDQIDDMLLIGVRI